MGHAKPRKFHRFERVAFPFEEEHQVAASASEFESVEIVFPDGQIGNVDPGLQA